MQMNFHVADAINDGFQKIFLRTVDIDVVELSVAATKIDIHELSVAFETGQHLNVPIR